MCVFAGGLSAQPPVPITLLRFSKLPRVMKFWTVTNNGICHTFSEIILRVCNGKYEGVSDVSAVDDSRDL
jgi:hypothetical protein